MIDKKYRVPIEEISCPGCGQRYGHHNTKVCEECAECSTCCWCDDKTLISPEEFIEEVIGYKPLAK